MEPPTSHRRTRPRPTSQICKDLTTTRSPSLITETRRRPLRKLRRKSTINLIPFFLSLTNASAQSTEPPPICTPCPSTTWALAGSSDCAGYYVCVNGEPSTYLGCPPGTKWNTQSTSCEEGDGCECSSSYKVDVAVTSDATEGEVIIVNPWYPVFDEGVQKCFNDGKQ
jgi:hypothetical protein